MNSQYLKKLNFPLFYLVLINLLPGLLLRSIWISVVGFAIMFFRCWLELKQKPVPPRWVQWLAQLTVGFLIFFLYQSIIGDEAAGSLLSLLCCLKTFELRTKRDYFINTLLCVLVLMSNLLADQSLTMTLFLLLDAFLILNFFYLLEEKNPDLKIMRRSAWSTFTLVAKGFPLLVVIFLLFPRFSTGFGGNNTTTGKMGITDQLRPGSVSQLVQSEEVVFRASFLGSDRPLQHNLYWRGAVLDVSRGLHWDRDSAPSVSASLQEDAQIEIFLEPGFDLFLFAPENVETVHFPVDLNRSRVVKRGERIFELDRPLQTRERYLVYTSENYLKEPLKESHRYLRVEKSQDPRVQELLNKLRQKSASSTVDEILTFYQKNNFVYSLTPPPVATFEEFLFTTKTGFCEHYAATTATLLRLLGIPSRVITGFQGGTSSILDSFITVRGLDAHAWVEFYDANAGRWKRLDPTSVIAPARLSQGSVGYSNSDSFLLNYRRLQAFLDEVEANWIGLLMRYDLSRQKELLAKLGMEGVLFRALPVLLVLILSLILAIFYFLEAQRKEPIPPEEAIYRQLLKVIDLWGVPRSQTDGPLTLLEKTKAHSPSRAMALEPVLLTLTRIRYGGQSLSDELRREIFSSIKRLRKS